MSSTVQSMYELIRRQQIRIEELERYELIAVDGSRCQFCGSKLAEVAKMVKGQVSCICDQCIKKCAALIGLK